VFLAAITGRASPVSGEVNAVQLEPVSTLACKPIGVVWLGAGIERGALTISAPSTAANWPRSLLAEQEATRSRHCRKSHQAEQDEAGGSGLWDAGDLSSGFKQVNERPGGHTAPEDKATD
jgi:hypothetical protein